MAEINHRLFIASPIRKVYESLTDENDLSKWWTSNVQSTDAITAVLKFTFGAGYFKEMKIVSVAPDAKVEWLCMEGATEWVGTSIIFELSQESFSMLSKSNPELEDQLEQSECKGEGTLLVFKHINWKNTTAMFSECSYTWAMFLRSLKLYCETGNRNSLANPT